jgi:carbonic anhydrase/acetyltransferase-like protein (isoleucine patch superfamily)
MQAFSSFLRTLGQSLERLGARIEPFAYVEHLQPSTKVISHLGKSPQLGNLTFLAPSASLIGNVTVGNNTSIMYGSVLRGDLGQSISVGANSFVGDNVVIHVSGSMSKHSTNIGEGSFIGSGAVIHGATIGNGCVIGQNATVMDGAVVEDGAYVLPGSTVTKGKHILKGQVWGHLPASHLGELTHLESSRIQELLNDNLLASQEHATELTKDIHTYEQERTVIVKKLLNQYEDDGEESEEEMRKRVHWVDGVGIPGEIFNKTKKRFNID